MIPVDVNASYHDVYRNLFRHQRAVVDTAAFLEVHAHAFGGAGYGVRELLRDGARLRITHSEHGYHMRVLLDDDPTLEIVTLDIPTQDIHLSIVTTTSHGDRFQMTLSEKAHGDLLKFARDHGDIDEYPEDSNTPAGAE